HVPGAASMRRLTRGVPVELSELHRDRAGCRGHSKLRPCRRRREETGFHKDRVWCRRRVAFVGAIIAPTRRCEAGSVWSLAIDPHIAHVPTTCQWNQVQRVQRDTTRLTKVVSTLQLVRN